MNEHVISYIKNNYIKSKINPHFAVLVKGDWGCGKTFLVKKILNETYGKKYKDNVIWISVYGLSSIQQLRQKLIEKIYPFLSNKITKFALSTVKAGLKASTTIDFNKDGYEDLFIDFTIPNFESDENGKKIKTKKILILDDIERCSIPITEIFGFFAEEIIEKNLKAIFISNDEKIKDTQEQDDYNSIKEKIIGMEFNVEPDITDAVKSFIKELRLEHNEELLTEKSVNVLSTLKFKNLRSIRQAFVHISQIYEIIGKTDIDKDYISNVIEFFLVLYIQKAKGDINSTEDFLDAIEAYKNEKTTLKIYEDMQLNKKYLFRYAKVPLQNIYFDIIVNGNFSPNQVLEDYKNWTMPDNEKTPYQKLYQEWFNYSDIDFNNLYNSVQKDFDNNKILNQSQLVGLADLKFELAENGVIGESKEQIKNSFFEYIQRNKSILEPYDLLIPLRGHFTRCKNCNSELLAIEAKLRDVNLNLIKERVKSNFIELYSNIPEKISDLVRFVSYGEKNSYFIPILSLIDINDLYLKMKGWDYSCQVTLYQSFEERYGKKNSMELKKEFYPDIDEIKKIADLYKKDAKEIVMSPQNAQKKWLSDWYNDLYEYMVQSKEKQENKELPL